MPVVDRHLAEITQASESKPKWRRWYDTAPTADGHRLAVVLTREEIGLCRVYAPRAPLRWYFLAVQSMPLPTPLLP